MTPPQPQTGIDQDPDHRLFIAYKLFLLPSAPNPAEVMRFQTENNLTLPGFNLKALQVGAEANGTT